MARVIFFTLLYQTRCATRNEHELIDMTEVVCYRSNPFHSAPEVLEPQPLGNSKFGARLCESWNIDYCTWPYKGLRANCPPRMNQQRALVRMPLDSVVLMVAVCAAGIVFGIYYSIACLLESKRPDSNPRRGRSKHGRNVLYGHRRDVYGAGIILGELLLRFSPHIGNGLNLNSMTPKTRMHIKVFLSPRIGSARTPPGSSRFSRRKT